LGLDSLLDFNILEGILREEALMPMTEIAKEGSMHIRMLQVLASTRQVALQ